MEELRALVRKWNLHHKRNFWRENPTKDDVVAALNRHIKHMKLVHDHIENKKAERREADRKRQQVQNASGEGISPPRKTASLKRRPPLESSSGTCLYSEGVALPRLDNPSDTVLPADSVETGIIYMSRWVKDNAKSDEHSDAQTENNALQEPLERRSASPQRTEAKDDGDDCSLQGSAKDNTNKMQAQQKCCLALLNMTMRDQVDISRQP